MNTKLLRYTACAALWTLTWGGISAQNTIGGLQQEVPEAELDRQNKFLNAEAKRMLGKHDEAVDAYKKFLYENEKNGAAWYGLSRSYTALKDWGKALDAVTKALENEPDNQWYHIHQADLLEQMGRVKDAARVYETLTKRYPNNPAFYERQAYLAVLAADPQMGLKALDRLEKLRGINEATSTKKHLIYVGLNDNKRAADELLRLADAYPTELEYRHSLARFYLEIGDQAAARRTYEDILKRRPDDTKARFALLDKTKSSSDATFVQGLRPLFQDPAAPIDAKIKQVVPYLEKLEKTKEPALASALLDLGTDLEKAHPDDPKAWSLSGDLLYLLDRDDEALTRYRRCIALRPRVFSVWDNALTILAAQKKNADMLPLAEQAMDAFPNQAKAYYWYARAANALNRPDDALAQADQALLMVGNNAALRLDLIDQAGLALMAKRDYPAAAARYEQAFAKGGDRHAGILEHLGDALAAQSRTDEARSYWKKAIAIERTPSLEEKIK
jgi:tetratricopeptide (TPR) repeat protein